MRSLKSLGMRCRKRNWRCSNIWQNLFVKPRLTFLLHICVLIKIRINIYPFIELQSSNVFCVILTKVRTIVKARENFKLMNYRQKSQFFKISLINKKMEICFNQLFRQGPGSKSLGSVTLEQPIKLMPNWGLL